MRRKKYGSWKTTTGGVIAFCAFVLVLLQIWNSYLTNQPIDTEKLLVGLVSLATAINGLSARDNDKTSRDVGID